MLSISVEKNTGESNLNEIIDLIRLSSEHLHHNALGDHAWLDLVQGGRSSVAGFIAKEYNHPHIVGYAQLSKGSDSWALEYVIHPGHYDNCVMIGTELLKFALRDLELQGGGHIHMWVPKPDANSDLIAANNNMTKGRVVIQMKLDLSDKDFNGFTVSDKNPVNVHINEAFYNITYLKNDQDETDWLTLNNAAFDQHPEQGNWDHTILKQRKSAEWFENRGFLLCREAITNELVASCWVKIHDHHENKAGEIYVIAVNPNYKGKKLGETMLKAGLAYMKGRKLNLAILYVDSENKTAINLYEKFGFTEDHVDQAYVIDLLAPTM